MAQRPTSDRLKIVLMLGPAMIVLGGLFFGGLGIVLLRSFNYAPALGLTHPNFDAYSTILTTPVFYRSLAFSLHIAITSTLLSTMLAIAVALLLRQSFAGRRIVSVLFQLGLTVPHLIGAIGILYLFSQSGLLARVAHEMGLIGQPADFPALVYDRFGIGIILQYVWKEVPFICLIVLAQMQGLGADFEAAARSLGASRWQAFRHVLLPLIMPGVLAAAVMVFAFTFGAYEIPAILGPNAPATLPVLAYRKFTDVDLAARPEAMALAVIIALVSAVLIAISLSSLRGEVSRK
jgi:putative spermidine/putrescine transport system permease protein